MVEIIPAVDIKGGRCVRLLQGDMAAETVYFDNPLEAAGHWVSQGAERLHIVDLDGAVSGSPRNRAVIERIVNHVSVPVQVGGGIRTRDDIQSYFDCGVDRVIVGTAVLRDPHIVAECARLHPKRLFLGIDARNGLVAVEGWTEVTKHVPMDLIRSYLSLPVGGVIYTDISRDGMLTGPNIAGITHMVRECPLPIIASGGVSTVEDVLSLVSLAREGLLGIIIGKALYSGALTLRDAMKTAANRCPG